MEHETYEVRRGVAAGRWCLFLVIASMVLSVPGAFFQDNFYLQGLLSVVGLGILATYTMLLLGILKVAEETGDNRFINDVWVFIITGVVCGLILNVFYFPTLFSPSVLATAAIIMVVTFFLLGIYSIRLSKDFSKLNQSIGPFALKAARWYKISGWLIVTLILLPIGFLLSLVADYYTWKMLKKLPAPRIMDGK